MIRTLAGTLAVGLLLSGCASGGMNIDQGGVNDALTSVGSDHSFSFACRKWDAATGNLTDEVTVQRGVNPNAAFVAAVGALGQAALALAGKAAAGAATGGVGALGARGVDPGRQLDVPTCLGEHGVNTPMPVPPNPTPPQPLVASAADPRLEPGRHVGPGGHVRYLEAADGRTACWRGETGTEHCGTVADWLAWASHPPQTGA